MEYGIQRRGIYLIPPSEADIEWFCSQFEQPEVWEMFGLERPSKLKILRQYRSGDLVLGILHVAATKKRVGFVVMFPPDPSRDYWEFGYAIVDPADRDAFSAFNATDAMAHYMFDHLHVSAMGWRTRADNRAADAVIRRLGYRQTHQRTIDGRVFTFYRIDQADWDRRRLKLEKGEEAHPSGIGGAFRTLENWPFDPVQAPQPAQAAELPTPIKPAASGQRDSAPRLKAVRRRSKGHS